MKNNKSALIIGIAVIVVLALVGIYALSLKKTASSGNPCIGVNGQPCGATTSIQSSNQNTSQFQAISNQTNITEYQELNLTSNQNASILNSS